jgi:hypothetical protein
MATPNIKQAPPPPAGSTNTFTFQGNLYTKDQFVTYYVDNWENDPFIREDFINLFYATGIFYGVDLAATGPTRKMWERIGDWAVAQSKANNGKFVLTSANMNQGIQYALSDKNKTILADFGAYVQKAEDGPKDTTSQQLTKKDAIIQLRKFAYDNGLVLSDKSLDYHANRIVGLNQDGKTNATSVGSMATLESTKQLLRDKYVLPKYQGYQDEIKAGFDLRDVANDYIQLVSQELELDPETLDLNDSLIQQALKPAKKQGGTFEYISYGDFQSAVRKDKRWQYTNNAKESLSTAATGIKRLFGL